MGALGLIGVVLRRMRPHMGRLVLAVAGVMLAAALEVLKPWPLKVVIDNVLRGTPLSAAWPTRASQLSSIGLGARAPIEDRSRNNPGLRKDCSGSNRGKPPTEVESRFFRGTGTESTIDFRF